MKVARLSALRTGRLYPPGKTPGTHFCCRLSRPQGHSATGRITSVKNPNDRIGNRTRSASTNCATTYPVRGWWVVKCIPWPPHPRKRDPIPIVQEAGWAPGPILRKISPQRGFHLRTESLYRHIPSPTLPRTTDRCSCYPATLLGFWPTSLAANRPLPL
jgi:hypothetical protein